MKRFLLGVLSVGIIAALVVAYYWFISPADRSKRSWMVIQWIRNPGSHADWAVKAGSRCGDAPFTIPTDGFIGYLWDDRFQKNHPHQGIDIFGGTEPGVTPVYAAYDGYLTRLEDWKSTVILRIPSDPLHPGQQIWTYYTHMADANGTSTIAYNFPPGSYEVFVKAGTLLGTQGNYSGTAGNPVGVHLHFSIVKDDGSGKFKNELEIANTLDPSSYFGLELNVNTAGQALIQCGE